MSKLRIPAVALMVLMASTAVAQARTVLFTAGPASAARPTVARYEPARLTLPGQGGVPLVVSGIHWRGWGTPRAVGHGTARLVFVGGGTATRRARVVLTRRHRFVGRGCPATERITYYRRMRVRLAHAGALPGPYGSGGTLPGNLAGRPSGAC